MPLHDYAGLPGITEEIMIFKSLVLKNRSYRRFDESFELTRDTLLELVDLARLTPSAANLQPLKYFLSAEKNLNERIFPYLNWAGYLKDWPGPAPGERPTGYIIICGDSTIAKNIDCDHGIAAQTILLGAVENGLGGCMIASLDRTGLQKEIKLPENFRILLVLAIGKPVETVVLEEAGEKGIRYYRDEKLVHHVPKRPLKEIVINYD